MSQYWRNELRKREKGRGWATGAPTIYPGGNAGVGAYRKSGSGAGTPQAGGEAGYQTPGPEKTIAWPGAGGGEKIHTKGGHEKRRVPPRGVGDSGY